LAVSSGIRSGSYEDNVTEAFRRFLHPGMGAIDVGANVGFSQCSQRRWSAQTAMS
jgi:hypothetical protein